MAARKRKIRLTEEWKDKISAGRIMNRLLGHVDGEIEMSTTQVAAARILLAKVVPDLQSTQLTVPQNIVHEIRWNVVKP